MNVMGVASKGGVWLIAGEQAGNESLLLTHLQIISLR
jgi:hypothetical protein